MNGANVTTGIELGRSSLTQAGLLHELGSDTLQQPLEWQLPVEVPVAIMVNLKSLAVMMATPADLEDMAIGFLLAEGYFEHSEALGAVEIIPTDNGFCVDVTADPKAMRQRGTRAIEGRSGCGLCGVQKLTDVVQAIPYRQRDMLSAAAVAKAFGQLERALPIKAVNFSVHGAGFATMDGALINVREDVGRHNALDKLVGALARQGIDPATGFAVMTSRCSFELVQKSAIAGLAGLATISAPTTLAIEMAQAAGLPLAFHSKGAVVFLDSS